MSASQFDLSCITLSLTTADAHASAFDAMTAEMLQWHAAGVYPERQALIVAIEAAGRKASTAKVYASRILAWAKAGRTPRTIGECVNDGPKAAGKGGRPKGSAKTPTAADVDAADDTADDTADTAGDPFNPAAVSGSAALPAQWVMHLESIRAQLPAMKGWAADDIVAAQDCAMRLLALIKKNRT